MRFFFLGLLLLLGGCTSLTGLFFYPQKIWVSTPSDVGLEYQDVFLQAADKTELHAWWLPAQGETEKDVVVLYLHGNAENISSHSRSMYWLAMQGVGFLALDYRGFGASQGRAKLPEVFQDLEAAVLWLRHNQPQKKIVIVAQSIGTALAVPFVAKAQNTYHFSALYLDAPVASYGTVARSALSKSVVGWLVWPWTVLIPSRWDALNYADQLELPVMVMHSPEDKVVPYQQGQKLFNRLPKTNQQRCWVQSQGAHIMSFAYAELRQQALQFITTQKCFSSLP